MKRDAHDLPEADSMSEEEWKTPGIPADHNADREFSEQDSSVRNRKDPSTIVPKDPSVRITKDPSAAIPEDPYPAIPEDPNFKEGDPLPDDWFDEEPIEHTPKRWPKVAAAIIAIILAIAMTLYYTVPILIPVQPNPLPKDHLAQNEGSIEV